MLVRKLPGFYFIHNSSSRIFIVYTSFNRLVCRIRRCIFEDFVLTSANTWRLDQFVGPSVTQKRASRYLPLSLNSHGGERNDHCLSRTPSYNRSATREPVIRPFTSGLVNMPLHHLRTALAMGLMVQEKSIESQRLISSTVVYDTCKR